ncbi:hypothetical protein [Microbacterium sp. dk485]|uniref:hypothetical protein n=1 Tax=Microbacterium sp. dk485 TaxID=2560021 RepID=UPI001430106A|nr:hypothetical protein [Microbacterium sp. dk485]
MTPISPTLDDLLREENWLEWRAHAEAVPAVRLTEMVTTDQSRAEFVEGARLLRLDQKVRAGDGGTGPSPEQLLIADVLNAGRFITAICDPRRSTKTTSVQAVVLGRCTLREDYQVGWTMCTTGAKASERFRKDIVAPIMRLYPNPKDMPFSINLGKGSEAISWPNGSFFNVYSPNGDGFRSGGFDMGVADEGGEADVELSDDITVAVLPTMDTKPGAQFVIPGTAAKFRDGNLLWDNLNDPDAGVVWRGIPESTDPEELEDWESSEDHPRARMRELIERAHPGVGWTTPIEAVERNFRKFGRTQFLAEYGGMFGSEGVSTGLISAALRERAALSVKMPPAPENFTLAISVHPDGLWASVGVAWRYEEQEDLASTAWKLDGQRDDARPPRTAIGLLHHQSGVQGFAMKVLTLARKYRVPVIFDQLSQAVGVEVETLSRATPRPALTPATTSDVRRAATKTLQGFEQGSLVYFREQGPLENALEYAVKRPIGTAGGFGFGRRKDHYEDDITPVEACSLALHFLDSTTTKISPRDAFQFE